MSTQHNAPPKTLILHIGSPKTGSTSIQKTLLEHASELKQSGVFFPNKLFPHHLTFRCIFMHKPYKYIVWLRSYDRSRDKQQQKSFRKKWHKELSNNKCQYTIISAEGLFSLNKAEISDCMTFLRHYFDVINIIVYMRDTSDFCRSLLQEMVKNGTYYEDINVPLANFKILSGKSLRCWYKYSGADEFIVRPFSKQAFVNGNLIDDLFASIGLNFIDISGFQSKRWNSSIGNNSFYFISQFNKKYPTTIGDNINPERMYTPFTIRKIFQTLPDDPFSLDVKYSASEAELVNRDVDFINSFFPKNSFKFSHVEASDVPTVLPDIQKIDLSYFTSCINEYNKIVSYYENEIKSTNVKPIRKHIARVVNHSTFLKRITLAFRRRILTRFYNAKKHILRHKNRTLIIHIGSPKAGSSSIQDVLYKKSSYLKKRGIIYSRKLHHNNATFRPLFMANTGNSIQWLRNASQGDVNQQKENYLYEWSKLFSKFRGKYFIISSELLIYTNKQHLDKCMEYLRSYFSNIKIIVYVRSVPQYMKSQFQEVSKYNFRGYSQTKTLDHIKSSTAATFLKNWINNSHADEIIVRPFDKAVFHNGSLIKDFFHHAGLDHFDTALLGNPVANRSLSYNSVNFLYQYNKRYPFRVDDKYNPERGCCVESRFVNEIYPNVKGKPFKLDVKFTESEALRINQDIDYLNSLFNENGYTLEHVIPSDEKTELLDPDTIDLDYYIELINVYCRYISRLRFELKNSFFYKVKRIIRKLKNMVNN